MAAAFASPCEPERRRQPLPVCYAIKRLWRILTSGESYDVMAGDTATAAQWHEGDDVLVCGDTIINKDEHGEKIEVTPTPPYLRRLRMLASNKAFAGQHD